MTNGFGHREGGADADHHVGTRRGTRYENDRLEIPVILLAAITECDISLRVFIERLLRGPLWQDDAIRSPDRRVVVQAHLAADGLRCVIQIGDEAFYHHPVDVLHVYHAVLPATAMALRDVDAEELIDEPLIRIAGTLVRRIRPLNVDDQGMGIALLLSMPAITLWLPR